MQKTVLEEILKAEKDAEAIIKQARDKATEIIAAAESDYNKVLSQAKEEAQQEIQNSIKIAKEKAEKDFENAVKEENAENLVFLQQSSEKTDAVAEKIVQSLLTPEYEKE